MNAKQGPKGATKKGGTAAAVAGLVERLAEDRVGQLLDEIRREHGLQLAAAREQGRREGRQAFANELLAKLGFEPLPSVAAEPVKKVSRTGAHVAEAHRIWKRGKGMLKLAHLVFVAPQLDTDDLACLKEHDMGVIQAFFSANGVEYVNVKQAKPQIVAYLAECVPKKK